ncbi:MAG: hypothetical protein ABI758_03195 [Candidatus Woesebacteria bacterium]
MKLGKKESAEKERESKASKPREKKREEPKDPTRWLPLLFLLIFLFISYLFWVAFQG